MAKILTGMLIALVLVLAWREWTHREVVSNWGHQFKDQKRAYDSVEAKLAQKSIDVDFYRQLIDAAKSLGGKPVAAVALKVPKRTVEGAVPTKTEIRPDSGAMALFSELTKDELLAEVFRLSKTRVATFRDSTFAGIIEGTIYAGPCCSDIRVFRKITRPEFTPKILLAQNGRNHVVLVEWQNESYAIEQPAVDLKPEEKRISGYLGAWYGPFDGSIPERA
jgi:hypothetical protein